MSSITIRGLEKSYGRGPKVIEGLDLEVEEGEFVSLLGPSGCGKTTTLRCVAGLEHADEGQVRIGDRLVSSPRDKVFVAPNDRHIGMVFQNYALWPHMTVGGNVGYPLKTRKVRKGERQATVLDALDSVGLAEQVNRPATLLSGGQQQRVALARAMVGSPTVLLFDEPLSNLDAQLRQTMRKQIRRVHDMTGVASLFVTHDQLEATELSDRILVMRAGAIEQMGSPRTLYRNPHSRFVAEFVGFENFIRATVRSVTDDVASFLTDSGLDIWCTTRRPLHAGQRVDLAIRSKDVRIHAEAPADRPNVASALLTGFVYSGDELRYELALGGDPIKAVRADDPSTASLAFHPGPQNAQIAVEFPPNSIVVLPATDDQETGPDFQEGPGTTGTEHSPLPVGEESHA